MRFPIIFLFLSCCLLGQATAEDKESNYTLYLVRHAEKHQDGSRDPGLTEVGKNRSGQLAGWLQDKAIKEIWSSDYKRTRDTGKPALSMLGLELSIYDAHKLEDLAKKLRHAQQTALVVGHSNTTPDLARLLCNCAIADMDDSEHDRLIVISVTGAETRVSTLRQNQLLQP